MRLIDIKIYAFVLSVVIIHSSPVLWAYCPTCEEDDGTSPFLCEKCDPPIPASDERSAGISAGINLNTFRLINSAIGRLNRN